jgi:hypothetical protein
MLFRSIGWLLTYYMALYPRRQYSSIKLISTIFLIYIFNCYINFILNPHDADPFTADIVLTFTN